MSLMHQNRIHQSGYDIIGILLQLETHGARKQPRLDKHLPPPSLACKTKGFCRHAFTSISLYMPDFDDSLGGQTLGSNNNEDRL